jgi:site-specific recombinase XerD
MKKRFYLIVKKTAQQAGLSEAIGVHTLQRTGCTLALEAGASVTTGTNPRPPQERRDHHDVSSPAR